jgi:hypothetical protein
LLAGSASSSDDQEVHAVACLLTNALHPRAPARPHTIERLHSGHTEAQVTSAAEP